MAPTDCPDRETLAALAAGLLSGEALAAVAAHLDGCPACLAVAQSANTDTDPLVAALCQPDPADPYAREEGCDRARARLLATDRDDVAPDLPTLIAPGHRPPGPPEATAGSPPGGVSTGESVGTLVAGRYKLLEKIGEGGMGAVWAAEQTQPVRRKVAIKLVKAGMDSRTVLARFDAERQALALMDHPNIAKVLDGGTTETGRPFFVMEYVAGVPLTRYCDDARLSIAERLALFVPVCQAVQHAHAKGVIHRDLKPSNILVGVYDGRPAPKVIDFGLAKAVHQPLTEHSLHTAPGAMLGTLLYISPEQAAFNNPDVDTRTDVYALGVVLYELLTGTTPLERERLHEAAWHELLRLIKEEEPPRPSDRLSGSDALPSVAAQRQLEPVRLIKLVRGELDWIVMKCLEKDRSRRYETANGLARDVERYLTDETVEASPPGAGYRLRKFVKRNKGRLVAAGLVLVALLAGMAGTLWGLIRAERALADTVIAQRAATDRAEGERRAREEAQRRLAQVEKGTEVLASVFRDLDPADEEKEGVTLRVLLGRRLAEAVQQLEGEAVGDPLTVARLQHVIGISLRGLGHLEQAEAAFAKARRTREQWLGADHLDTISTHHNLASLYRDRGKLPQAESLYREVVAARTARLGADHADTLSSKNNLALVCMGRGKYPEAEALLKEVLATRIARLGADDPMTLQSKHNLSSLYHKQGKYAEAEALLKEVLAARTVRLGPGHLDTLKSKIGLAELYKLQGRPAEAIRILEEVMAVSSPGLGPGHPFTLAVKNNLAGHYLGQGKYSQAETLFKEVLEAQTTRLGPDHPHALITRTNLAGLYWSMKRPDESLPLLAEAIKLSKAKLGSDHPDTLRRQANLGVLYRDTGRSAEGLSLLVDVHRKGRKYPELEWVGDELLMAYVQAGKTTEAKALATERVGAARARSPADDSRLATTLAVAGKALLEVKAYADAEPLLRESLSLRERQAPHSWLTHNSRSLLGGALLGQKRYAEAESLLIQGYEAIRALESQIPPQVRIRVSEAGERIVQLYEAWGRPDKAAEWRTKLTGTGEAKPKP